MRYYTNQDCANAFITGEAFTGFCSNVSFTDDEFYSYSTCITKRVQGYGQQVLLISNNNFSNTTSKHINCLRHSFYKETHKIDAYVLAPFRYGDSDVSLFTLADRFLDSFKGYANCDFSHKNDRIKFAVLYQQAKVFSEKVLTLDFLVEPWLLEMVLKIREIENYKKSKIKNYYEVLI